MRERFEISTVDSEKFFNFRLFFKRPFDFSNTGLETGQSPSYHQLLGKNVDSLNGWPVGADSHKGKLVAKRYTVIALVTSRLQWSPAFCCFQVLQTSQSVRGKLQQCASELSRFRVGQIVWRE